MVLLCQVENAEVGHVDVGDLMEVADLRIDRELLLHLISMEFELSMSEVSMYLVNP